MTVSRTSVRSRVINCRLLAVKLAFRNARGTAEKLEMIYEIVLNLNLTISFQKRETIGSDDWAAE